MELDGFTPPIVERANAAIGLAALPDNDTAVCNSPEDGELIDLSCPGIQQSGIWERYSEYIHLVNVSTY